MPSPIVNASATQLTVTDALHLSQQVIEHHFSHMHIIGEVSNLVYARSGHIYFSLKDAKATLRCAFFKNRQYGNLSMQEGDAIVVSGKLTLYPARGDFQCVVEHVRPYGEGELKKKFAELKIKLEQKGFFLESHKQELPFIPQRIGIITSSNAAALHDMLTTFKRRSPYLSIEIYPCLVQGSEAAQAIASTITLANTFNRVDVLILARGGGSIEDLWAFNELPVCEAIYESALPIITGIGHETDTTLSDLVADCRAATPTAASVMVAPSIQWLIEQHNRHLQRLQHNLEQQLQHLAMQVDRLEQKAHHAMLAKSPHQVRLNILIQRLNHASKCQHQHHKQMASLALIKLRQATLKNRIETYSLQLTYFIRQLTKHTSQASVQSAHDKLNLLMKTLKILDPSATLKRGYLSAHQQQKSIHSIKDIDISKPLTLVTHDGSLTTQIEHTEKN